MGLSSRHGRTHLAVFVLVCLLAVYCSVAVAPVFNTAHAQESPAPTPPKVEKKEATGPGFFEVIGHIFGTLIHDIIGIIMGITFLLLSMALVFLVVLMIMDLRMSDAVPPAFVEEFTDTVNKRKFKDAFEMAKSDNSYLAKVLATGMSRLQFGIEDARQSAFNTVESMKAGKEQFITYMATIGTIGPLLGLVGTVYSMIGAFMQLGKGQTTAQDLAGTLSHGLVVTLIGIGLAAPAIFCHAFFKNRLIKISMETANVADDLLTQMYHNSRKPAPPGDPAGGQPQTVRPAK
jgi:biopolymer transport protein ExbB